MEGEGEWNARKHGGPKRRVWRQIHIGIDEKSLEIRAAEFTTSDIGDTPMLPDLLDQIPPEQEIASVATDGAFDTRNCHDSIAARGSAAIIPPRRNTKPWKADSPGAIARNEALRASRRLGRTIWRRWTGNHRRSRADTKMHGFTLLGQRLSAWDFDHQVAELQVRVAVLNGFTTHGIPITKVTGQVCPGKGELRPSADLCNRANRPDHVPKPAEKPAATGSASISPMKPGLAAMVFIANRRHSFVSCPAHLHHAVVRHCRKKGQ